MTKKVLFLCTGNYYWSRFAEMLFNALASRENLDWNADSHGLATNSSNVGPVYPGVLHHLKTLGFPVQTEPRFPARLETEVAFSRIEKYVTTLIRQIQDERSASESDVESRNHGREPNDL